MQSVNTNNSISRFRFTVNMDRVDSSKVCYSGFFMNKREFTEI
jgi:hypothetical protein